MYAYRHLFHAGNFADVFKHALLVRLLLSLAAKPKPYCYLDSHAGIGRYDLSHEWASKNSEYQDGIERLWSRPDLPALLEPYLAIVRQHNPDGVLRCYPGSPLIARSLLRPQDRAVLSELNEQDYGQLAELFVRDRNILVQRQDGYQTLKAQLPPSQRRALVLIDSSFDRAGEYARLVQALSDAHRRFATGIYVIWYPMMAAGAVSAFSQNLIDTGIRRILKCELEVHPRSWSASLRGTGLIVVNPPFGFEAQAREIAGWLAPVLQQSSGAAQVQCLVGE